MQEEICCRTREASKVPGNLNLDGLFKGVIGIMKPNSSDRKEQKSWWETCWTPDMPLYAEGVSYQAYYSEVGKASHKGKDLTGARSPQRKLVPDM